MQRYMDEAPTGEQLAQKLYADVKTTLVSEMLTKVDRINGSWPGSQSAVSRSPSGTMGVHGSRRSQAEQWSGKRLLKEAMARDLPHGILHRPKQGFNVPMKLWMKSELREFVRDNLTASQIRRRGHFAPNAVERIVNDHFSGKYDASNKIFAMLMLELCIRRLSISAQA